jgi:hypothetical protein
MIRVVFDTSVLYSAILKPESLPARVFNLVTSGLRIPCVSPAVLAEYREILLERPALRHQAQRAMAVIEIMVDVAVVVTPNGTLNGRRGLHRDRQPQALQQTLQEHPDCKPPPTAGTAGGRVASEPRASASGPSPPKRLSPRTLDEWVGGRRMLVCGTYAHLPAIPIPPEAVA